MISKVIEEAMENMVRRIEALEDKLSRISIPNKKGFYEPAKQFQQNPNRATSGQIWKVKSEGGEPWEGMTKSEATKEIDRLLKEKEFVKECDSVDEPKEVDTEDAGLDAEDLL